MGHPTKEQAVVAGFALRAADITTIQDKDIRLREALSLIRDMVDFTQSIKFPPGGVSTGENECNGKNFVIPKCHVKKISGLVILDTANRIIMNEAKK